MWEQSLMLIPVTHLSHLLEISTLCSFCLPLSFDVGTILAQCIERWGNNRFPTLLGSTSLLYHHISHLLINNGPTTSIQTMVILEFMTCQYQFLQICFKFLLWIFLVGIPNIINNNITQLMSCVHEPRNRFENKAYGCRNPSASNRI